MRGTIVFQKHAANWDLHPRHFGLLSSQAKSQAGFVAWGAISALAKGASGR